MQALKAGISFMRGDRALLRLALVLGAANFLSMMTLTVQVLFAQEVLHLSAVEYGLVLSVAAAGAIAGSLGAPWLVRLLGAQACLLGSVLIWGLGNALIGLCGDGVTMALALFAVMAAAMLWNVITVSWRQRRIPTALLGRVNSIYRFFGWGTMPLGALAGGALVSVLQSDLGREAALRAPFLAAAGCYALLLIYAALKLRLR